MPLKETEEWRTNIDMAEQNVFMKSLESGHRLGVVFFLVLQIFFQGDVLNPTQSLFLRIEAYPAMLTAFSILY